MASTHLTHNKCNGPLYKLYYQKHDSLKNKKIHVVTELYYCSTCDVVLRIKQNEETVMIGIDQK